MRLIDTLCVGICRYPRPIPTVPDVLLLDIAAPYRSTSLSLGRYYPIIIETGEEQREVDAFLAVERTTIVAPDILDRRPSQLLARDILFCRYDPVLPGRPWVLLCHWPSAHTGLLTGGSDQFARGAYTIEMFDNPGSREAMEQALFASLGAFHPIEIVPVGIGVHGGRA